MKNLVAAFKFTTIMFVVGGLLLAVAMFLGVAPRAELFYNIDPVAYWVFVGIFYIMFIIGIKRDLDKKDIEDPEGMNTI